ncbi:threonylcarbamoyl-AMP synthase [Candidatus Saccharibacteria bacterium]|nr:MAG: threonylcarbamoyl-AMP synthase [Candidatus Saccharibacteria bacterium]
MNRVNDLSDPRVAEVLRAGGVVVACTDTIYGVLARADDERAVERVYAIKGRSGHKSSIVLITSYDQLYDAPTSDVRRLMTQYWPGKVSIVVPSMHAPEWLRRSNASVAYRMPAVDGLRQLIAKTGPLIAPSANPEGETPAPTVEKAVEFFGDAVDLYVDGGRVEDDTPSQLLRIDEQGNVEQLR